MRITPEPPKLDDFTRAYLTCALWASTDDTDEPLDAAYSIDDFSTTAMQRSIDDCTKFQGEAAPWLAQAYASEVYVCGEPYNPGCAGHDFWLTRNDHGAGFWDRGLGTIGDKLTEAAHGFGEVNLCVENRQVEYL